MLIPALLCRIEEFRRRSGRRDGGISTELFGAGKTIALLRKGKTITVRSLERAHRELDRLEAEFAASRDPGQGGGSHVVTVPERAAECDRNGAAQLQRGAA